MGDGPNDVGLSRRHLRRALDASLRRLGVDRVDLYQVHALRPADAARGDAAASSTTRSAPARSTTSGCRTSPAGSCRRPSTSPSAAGLAAPVTLQPQYNLLVREIEWEIVPACAGQRARPAAVVAARRRLADRQVHARRAADRRDPARREPGPRRRGLRPAQHGPAHLGRRRRGPAVAERRAAPRWPQVALAWLADRPARDLGDPRRPHRSSSSTTTSAPPTCTWRAEETARLDAASDPAPADYPYGGPGVEQRSREI